MFEPERFRKQFTLFKNVHVTLLGLFGATRIRLGIEPPRYAPDEAYFIGQWHTRCF